jgi:hypothetical protein
MISRGSRFHPPAQPTSAQCPGLSLQHLQGRRSGRAALRLQLRRLSLEQRPRTLSEGASRQGQDHARPQHHAWTRWHLASGVDFRLARQQWLRLRAQQRTSCIGRNRSSSPPWRMNRPSAMSGRRNCFTTTRKSSSSSAGPRRFRAASPITSNRHEQSSDVLHHHAGLPDLHADETVSRSRFQRD